MNHQNRDITKVYRDMQNPSDNSWSPVVQPEEDGARGHDRVLDRERRSRVETGDLLNVEEELLSEAKLVRYQPDAKGPGSATNRYKNNGMRKFDQGRYVEYSDLVDAFAALRRYDSQSSPELGAQLVRKPKGDWMSADDVLAIIK